jgi:hypothetical protein
MVYASLTRHLTSCLPYHQVSGLIAGPEKTRVELRLVSAEGREYQASVERQLAVPVSPSPYRPSAVLWGDEFQAKSRDALEVLVHDYFATHAPERVHEARGIAAAYVDNQETLNLALKARWGRDLQGQFECEEEAEQKGSEQDTAAWRRERDMKQHLSDAFDEQQRLRDLLQERERDMKAHLSEALEEQQRLRDILDLAQRERARDPPPATVVCYDLVRIQQQYAIVCVDATFPNSRKLD